MKSSAGRERVVKRQLADGTVKEYRYGRKVEPKSRHAPQSLGALIVAYERSPEFSGNRPSTIKNYGYYLRDLAGLADQPVAGIRRRVILSMRDAIAEERGHGAANVFMSVSTTLFNWAREREWLDHSPLDKVKRLEGGHLPAWTQEEADHAIQKLPETLKRAVILGLYTGQRRGDLCSMTWFAYSGEWLLVQQEKGGKKKDRQPLRIPVHPALKYHLDSWKAVKTSEFILTTYNGAGWKPNYLTQRMAVELPRIGLRDELNVHGLRKLAASALADAGCSTHEIASITGHKTLSMIQLYTASADQARLAKSAITRLQNRTPK